MKNLFLFLKVSALLLIVFNSFSQTLVPNQSNFYVSGSGTLPSNPAQLFDGDFNTPAKVPETDAGISG
jgi:hypothetical protein